MKKIIIHLFIVAILLMSSCKKWLEVVPEAQTTKDELFTTQKGFRDALTGAYIDMKSSDIYGGSLMWGNIEYMAKNWDAVNPNSQALPNLVAGNYSDATVRGWLDNTYAALYKVIADANGILDVIDAKQSIFEENNYALIKGESLALRAFCHFDVLRMFGPMPDNPGTASVLSYVKDVTSNIHSPIPYQDFGQAVLSDLDSAETLLKGTDPITQSSIRDLNPVGDALNDVKFEDDYLLYRQIRMNYYAVLALKARVYLWLAANDPSQQANAAKYAQKVISAVDQKGALTFRLGTETDRVAGDNTMSPEHILALSVYNLAAKATSTFGETGSLLRYDFNIQDGFYYLNNLFPVNERTSDVRWTGMWSYKSNNANYVMYKKYIQRDGSDQNWDTRPILQIPLLRISEMYLILTECAQGKEEAETAYATFCDKKGIPFSNGFNSDDWQTDRKNKLIREYVREFYAEGQSFFTYKRFHVITLPTSWTYSYYSGTTAKYIVPLPDREINYHNN
ncbi:SusD family protein [bacterium A37T11]|nr:SusD family protein [bacterium A37T11]